MPIQAYNFSTYYNPYSYWTNSSLHEDLNLLFAKYSKFKPDSAEYKKGLEYIECERNYTNQGEEYFKQINEKEAFAIGNNARQIYDYISNPWRIF